MAFKLVQTFSSRRFQSAQDKAETASEALHSAQCAKIPPVRWRFSMAWSQSEY